MKNKLKKAAIEMEQFIKIVIWIIVFGLLVYGVKLIIDRLTGG